MRRSLGVGRRRSSSLNQRSDLRGGADGILMLPDPDNRPAGFNQPRVRVRITPLVRLDLGAPVIRIGLRVDPVLRTAVPEAAVDEHGNPSPREDHVRASTEGRLRREINAEPQSARVQEPSDRELRLRVPALVGLHIAPHRFRRGPRVHTDNGSRSRCPLGIEETATASCSRSPSSARQWDADLSRSPRIHLHGGDRQDWCWGQIHRSAARLPTGNSAAPARARAHPGLQCQWWQARWT